MCPAESAGSAGILNNAQGVFIAGGNVSIRNNNERDTFGLLLTEVATTAFHNSAQRVNTPRCHAATRRKVLDYIFSWIALDIYGRFWLAWLHGAAGAGKTAIVQTVAEMCIASKIHVASFFFSRINTSRTTISPLVATLAYQIARLLPGIKPIICQVLEANPLVFRQSFNTQINELVIQPLLQLQEAGQTFKLVLLIDGLDECEGRTNQIHLISTLGQLLSRKCLPVYVLISSRSEYHLRMAFNALQLAYNTLCVALDDHQTFQPDVDILTYLNESLSSVRHTHPLAHCLGPDWPLKKHIQNIVEKASGQFIYATVVVKFLSQASASPASQLDIIAGLLPSTGQSTLFTELDTLYHHIFSTVQNIDTTLTFLSYILLTNEEGPVTRISAFFNVRPNTVFAAFATLASVVDCGPTRFRFLHASLQDFLIDETHSLDYYIDRAMWSTCFAIAWYQAYASHSLQAFGCDDILQFLNYAQPTNQLKAFISKFDPTKYPNFTSKSADEYLTAVKGLDFDDDGKLYQEQVCVVYQVIDTEFPDLSHYHQAHRTVYWMLSAFTLR